MSDMQDVAYVRRSELLSSSPASFSERSSPTPSVEARFQARLASIYGPVTLDDSEGNGSASNPVNGPVVADTGDDEDNGYEFRLFTELPQHGERLMPAARVIVRSPTPVGGQPGFVRPRKPDAYYFTGYTDERLLEQYRSAIVTGEDIISGLDIRWPGCELPWRIIGTKVIDSITKRTHASRNLKIKTGRRKRDGKKRRILKRMKLAAAKEKELIARQSNEEKEAANRAKRTRRNREKKIKKKQKEKLKKAEGIEQPG